MHIRFLFLVGIGIAFFSVLSYLFIDLPMARFFHAANHSWIEEVFEIITKFGESQYYLIPCFFVFMVYRRKKEALGQKALYLFSTIAVSGIIVNIIKALFGRIRPKLYLKEGLYGFDFFHIDYEYLSFPSGHAATSLSLTIALGILYPKFRYYLFVAGVIIAMSRVVITAHYLSDVFAGSYIGAIISIMLFHQFFKQKIDV